MKIMTFNSIFVIVLVTKINEFASGIFLGAVNLLLEDNVYKFEENSFLKKVYYWKNSHAYMILQISSFVADIISVFILSFIF